MRIMSFSQRWDKLEHDEFTTFRITRKDKDWQVGEAVQLFYRTRSKDREPLGVAVITAKKPVLPVVITDQEAIADGFPEGKSEMWRWLLKAHGERLRYCDLNKLTLKRQKTLDN
jgi:hypothetical protein